VRLAALQVLAAYYDPKFHALPEWLRTAHVGDPIPMNVHGGGRKGVTPLPESRTAELPALLARLARNDADPTVRHAALLLRQGLAFRNPVNTPVQPGTVSLIAGCGDRVTLRSTENILLGLQVSVLGTSSVHTIWLKGSPEAKPMTTLMSLPAGTVVVTYGGRELARLSERHAPCPPGIVPGSNEE
jgi:hypothetical protein